MPRPRRRSPWFALLTIALGLASAPAAAAHRRVADVPDPRYGSRLAYDAQTKQVVLFGGYDGFTLFGDTWVWDGSAWTKQHPSRAPSPRYGFGLAYDADTKLVVLFGGYDGVDQNDTWTWDGSNWNELHPATLPPARTPMSLAYDVATKQLLLWDYVYPDGGETWTWDGVDWTEQHPQHTPPYWDGYRMAYDGSTEQVILFGGGFCGDQGCGYDDKTWAWDGSNWVIQQQHRRPSGREAPALAYDQATKQFILFGGYGWGGWQNDTLLWNGWTWARTHPADSPLPRESAAITYDAARQQVVLFGGLAESVYGDTWIWDGTDWSPR